ncbi:Transcriptional regulator PadR-like family protein [Micromonospora viridifaciens]|uniref:Transcriptional regulator PadR-like family protein n=1 Tax=Micromonospora viridifaciens TaxID=1881 RepID=A0A1C4Y467_MICVI|nr:PadR family transcriptional regulator [Micromonospora viridifaciens]SCF15504.1 Transcriptional regulator PadR-like family protein [Micromonospora viridifaciens]
MSNMPMQESTYLILTALVEEPRHGYAILEEVRGISAGRVELRAGTLYAALDRLRTEGLVEVEREELVQSRLRRYYRLTALGARRLAEESARLRSNAEAASVRLRRAGLLAQGGAA